MKKRFSIFFVIIIVIISITAGIGINLLISSDNIYAQLNKFRDILGAASKLYVDEVDTEKLTEAAINGMLNSLDPHSVYIPPKQYEKVTEEIRGKFEGIGISFNIIKDTITVVEPIGGGPSARMGIISNDRIIKINDTSSVKWKDSQVMQSLRGPKGTKVKVTILRPGVKELLDFVIVRDVIALTSVDATFMINNDIGYILLNQFKETTNEEINKALLKLKAQGMRKLILDLRGNGGGILEQSVDIADLFLSGGTSQNPRTIVYTKSRNANMEQSYFAKTGDEYEYLPIIILIDNGSASASEILAGAIQDWDRGLIVGETSFGKGLVQRQITLSDGSGLRITVARYYTPSGRLIQRDYKGKDREEYHKEAFVREEEEGENISHSADAKQDTTIPKYKTAGGRTVVGGGGITPDYIVKSEKLTGLVQKIWRAGLFIDFTKSYLEHEGLFLRKKYENRFEDFKMNYEISKEMMNDFKKFIASKEIAIKDDEYEKDYNYLKIRLKAEIARTLFGFESFRNILVVVDNQLQKAITLFPEAEKIAKLKK